LTHNHHPAGGEFAKMALNLALSVRANVGSLGLGLYESEGSLVSLKSRIGKQRPIPLKCSLALKVPKLEKSLVMTLVSPAVTGFSGACSTRHVKVLILEDLCM